MSTVRWRITSVEEYLYRVLYCSVMPKEHIFYLIFFATYLQVSPRNLRPRPRTPRSTPTDCLKDHPATLSHTSKRNSTMHFASVGGHLGAPRHCRLLQTTTARHAHTVTTTPVLWKWGESWLLCQTITLNLECTLSCDGLWNLHTLIVHCCWTVAIQSSTNRMYVAAID